MGSPSSYFCHCSRISINFIFFMLFHFSHLLLQQLLNWYSQVVCYFLDFPNTGLIVIPFANTAIRKSKIPFKAPNGNSLLITKLFYIVVYHGFTSLCYDVHAGLTPPREGGECHKEKIYLFS